MTETKVDWIALTGDALRDGQIVNAIRSFEPLLFEPGRRGNAWLQEQLANLAASQQAILALDESHGNLLGFFALESLPFVVTGHGDRPIAQVRSVRKRLDPGEEQQPGSLICWLLRSQQSEKGFGEELFTYAIAEAWDAGSVALLVEPHDEETEKKVWMNRYRCRKRHDACEGEPTLWYPLGTVEGGVWPS